MAKTADEIVAIIVKEVTSKFIGSRKFEPDPFNTWKDRLKVHVQKRLDEKILDWDKSESNVKHVAKEMGRIAEALADDDEMIGAEQLDAAFQAARHHKRCPPGFKAAGQQVLGSWCDF